MALPKVEKAIYARKKQESNFLLATLLDNLVICSDKINEYVQVKKFEIGLNFLRK